MYQSVQDAFLDFIVQYEGYAPFMYLDNRNLVTTGVGNLIDTSGFTPKPPGPPWQEALKLSWKHYTGSWMNPTIGPSASQDEIIAAWKAVKSHTDTHSVKSARFSDLILERATVMALVNKRLASNEKTLKARFPDYDTWPANAQLALLSMAWSAGPRFNFAAFNKAAKAGDFAAMAKASHMKNQDPKRQNANYNLFMAAADDVQQSNDVTALRDLSGISNKQSA